MISSFKTFLLWQSRTMAAVVAILVLEHAPRVPRGWCFPGLKNLAKAGLSKGRPPLLPKADVSLAKKFWPG